MDYTDETALFLRALASKWGISVRPEGPIKAVKERLWAAKRADSRFADVEVVTSPDGKFIWLRNGPAVEELTAVLKDEDDDAKA